MMQTRSIIVWLLSILLCSVSCSTIELCEEVEHPHQSDLRVRYDFGENAAEKPAQMRILANRLFNTIRYSFVWSTDDEADGDRVAYLDDRQSDPNRSFYTDEVQNGEGPETEEPDVNLEEQSQRALMTREGEGDPEGGNEGGESGEGGEEGEEGNEDPEPEPEPEPEPDPVREEDPRGRRLRAGEYQLITLNYDEETLLSGLKAFMTNYDKRMNTLQVACRVHARAEQVDSKFQGWTDFNAGFPFVSNVGKLLVDQKSIQVESNKVPVTVTFAPRPVTQRIHIQWSVTKETEAIQIDSIHGELGGVVTSSTLQNVYLDMDGYSTARVLFEGSHSGNQCQAQVDVLGVMNSASADLRSGPGMLYIAIYATLNGKSRTIYAGVNLHDIIQANPSIKQTEDGKHFVASQPEVTWVIPTPLPLTVADFESGDHKEQGVDMWLKDPEQENFDIEM